MLNATANNLLKGINMLIDIDDHDGASQATLDILDDQAYIGSLYSEVYNHEDIYDTYDNDSTLLWGNCN